MASVMHKVTAADSLKLFFTKAFKKKKQPLTILSTLVH